ncbi:MAG: tetratricopeptide repeat protein, partial [Myxococcales bacterium]|nr:tetratricopeptide repeat protein [Myxococcales bacterium]
PAPPAARGALRPVKPALYLDEDAERPPLPVRRSGAGLWIALVLLLAAGAGVALGWSHIAPALGLGGGDEALVARLGAGATEHDKHTVEAYDAALREYLRASALAEADPRVLLGLARTEAAWAEALSFEADDLEARAAHDPALAGRAAAKRDEVSRRAAEARRHAEALLRVQVDLSGEVALADALRLVGQSAEARQRIDRASQLLAAMPSGQAASPEDASAYHVAVALLAGGWPEALPAARDAVSANPTSIRARLVLARALLATRDVAGARRELDEVLRRVPGHPRARALVDAIDRGLPPAAPTVEVEEPSDPDPTAPPTDAPTMEAASPREATPRETSPRETSPREVTPREPAPREAGGAPPAGRDYSFYVRRGEQLLDGGDLDGAQSHFELALQQRPGGAEALTGLGHVALRRGNAAEAARHFRPAARNDYGDAYIGLGDAYRRMGRTDEALQTYRAYLASRPNGPLASVARQHIANLEAQAPATMEATTMEATPAPTMEATSEPAAPREPPGPTPGPGDEP